LKKTNKNKNKINQKNDHFQKKKTTKIKALKKDKIQNQLKKY
jgi:hypothetical protein